MLHPGTVIGGRYQVIRLLGQGGMSNIYICQDTHLRGKTWAIKEFTARYDNPQEQQTALRYFEREARILSTLSHPNLPTVNDYFQYQGLYYFVMEYVEGEDLGKILERQKGPQEERVVAEWAVQVSTVLYYLHCQKPDPIVFRDIKPSNIIINHGQVKLIDFGIARQLTPDKKGDTMRIGSPGYAPPEQYNGQSDPRSDIYALGATMHQALTGIDPTLSTTPFVFKPVREANPKISEAMAAIVAKAIKVVPEERYQTMVEMKRELRALLQPHLAVTMPASAQPAAVLASQELSQKKAPAAIPPIAVTSSSAPTPVPSAAPPKPLPIPKAAQKQPAAASPAPAPPIPAPSRFGCIKRFFMLLMFSIIASGMLLAAVQIRAHMMGVSALSSWQRILDVRLIYNVLTYPQPLGSESQGGKMFLNGAPYQQCLEILKKEPPSPISRIFMQNCEYEDALRSMFPPVKSGGVTPIDIFIKPHIRNIAVLVPRELNDSGTSADIRDLGEQCLAGAALAQRFTNDSRSSAAPLVTLIPQRYSAENLSARIQALGTQAIRRQTEYKHYETVSYYADGALVFFPDASSQNAYINAIVQGSASLECPICAVGVSSQGVTWSIVRQGTVTELGCFNWNDFPIDQAVKSFKSSLLADQPQSLLGLSKSHPQESQARVLVSPFHPNPQGRQAYALYQRTFGGQPNIYKYWPVAFDALCFSLRPQANIPYQGICINISADNKGTAVPHQLYSQSGTKWLHGNSLKSSAPAPAAVPNQKARH
ncbi:MAG: protein kinase [bacterium]|nr:protein kinase [bacterium]